MAFIWPMPPHLNLPFIILFLHGFLRFLFAPPLDAVALTATVLILLFPTSTTLLSNAFKCCKETVFVLQRSHKVDHLQDAWHRNDFGSVLGHSHKAKETLSMPVHLKVIFEMELFGALTNGSLKAPFVVLVWFRASG